jgi:hypothetical protein
MSSLNTRKRWRYRSSNATAFIDSKSSNLADASAQADMHNVSTHVDMRIQPRKARRKHAHARAVLSPVMRAQFADKQASTAMSPAQQCLLAAPAARRSMARVPACTQTTQSSLPNTYIPCAPSDLQDVVPAQSRWANG